jgi:hypothetical protein
MLCNKVSGTSAGLWLLIPELLRLGCWDLLKGWTGGGDRDIAPRIALQMVNEAAMCSTRIRRKNSLGHQGFQLANGMSRLVTDQEVHKLLDQHTMNQCQELLIQLGIQRQLSGHYPSSTIAIDPHRIISTSKRVMTKKMKGSDYPAQKMIQTYFSVCTETGQPIMATMASSGMPTSQATKTLIHDTSLIMPSYQLIVADKEHYTQETLQNILAPEHYDVLVPVINSEKITKLIQGITYKPVWAGYAIAETPFSFEKSKQVFRLLAQRSGERPSEYSYSAFLTTSTQPADLLLAEEYDKRWTIESFFNFEDQMGLSRASTHNLNIRYGKLALTMMAQAATYQLRKKLNQEYKTWDAQHLANEIVGRADGDIRVHDDTIIVTFYGAPNHINPNQYLGLPRILESQGINPKIPWLYDFKLDFRFK